MKKEFYQNRILPKKQTIEELCNPTEFALLPTQKFLQNYVSLETPYNGVLVFAGVGSGKTCSAITIAEQFKENMRKYNRKILVILKKGIQKNFIKNIYDLTKEMEKERKDEHVQCTGETYTLSDAYRHLTIDQKERKIRAMIKQNYQFVGYDQFANEVLRQTGWDGNVANITPQIINKIQQYYSHRVIIVDEVHHVNVKTDKETKKVSPILMTIMKYAKNIRLVLMSATPMFDKPQEIVYLLNLLLTNDKRDLVQISDVFDKHGNLTENGEKLLKIMLRGYVSYFRGENPVSFPVRVYPKEAKVPLIKYNIYGNPIKSEDRLKYLKLILCHMSEYQWKWYKIFWYELGELENANHEENVNREENANEANANEANANEANKNDGNEAEEEVKEVKEVREITKDEEGKAFVQHELIWISNIVYPKKNGEIALGKKGITESDNGMGGLYSVSRIINNRRTIVYHYQSHVIFDKGTAKETPFLSKNKVGIFSDKFATALGYVIEAHGIIFVYSRYLSAGLIPFALMLEQNGIQRYEVDGDKQLLDYSTNSKGGGGKARPICYWCGKLASDSIHRPAHPQFHKWYACKYILLTGDKILTKVDIGKAQMIINNKNNIYGSQVKIILGNEAVSEGIDFHRIRQVHILEPWYNVSSLEQIIGRAVRNCSHQMLEEKERNVEVFLYSAVANKRASVKDQETETIDERNYRISENKDVKIKQVERILKEVAVDCVLNKPGNVFLNRGEIDIITSSGSKMKYSLDDKPNSRRCDYMERCNYKCVWEPKEGIPLKINEDTYNIIFAKGDVEQIKRNIKNLYLVNYIYDLTDILRELKKKMPNVEENFTYKALDELVKEKEPVYDKYNREGYLIYRGKYYVFQPKQIGDTTIPIYYREMPVTTKVKQIPIVGVVEEKMEEEVDIKKVIDEIVNGIRNLLNLLTGLVEENNISERVAYRVALGMILDRIRETDIVGLLKKIITKYNRSGTKEVGELEMEILEYYSDNLFTDNLIMDVKRLGKEIYGFKYRDKYYCVKSGIWSICRTDFRKRIEMLEKIREKRRGQKKSSDIIGLINHNKKGMVIFQIIDRKKYVEAVTLKARRSLRSEITGRVCDTHSVEQLVDFKAELGVKKSVHLKRKPVLCFELEFIFRMRQLLDDNKIWLDNYVKSGP